jgi:hypothetical protein
MPFETASTEAPTSVWIEANSDEGADFMAIAFHDNKVKCQAGFIAINSRR